MAEAATKLPVKTEDKNPPPAPSGHEWWPFENLRREIDHLFNEFDRSAWRHPFGRARFEAEPLWRGATAWGTAPAVDIVEKDKAYELTAELPGLDETMIEVKFAQGVLTIKGEKKEEKEEKRKDYYLSERRFGAFERSFRVPSGVDGDKIEASFKKGVLTVILPKTPEAQKQLKKIEVKAG